MRLLFQRGETKHFSRIVSAQDSAQFPSGEVHPVYGTFALARDAEWSGRLFVLEMTEDDEEGIGTGLSIRHISPALIGEKVSFESEWISIDGNLIQTEFTAKVGDRLIAKGTQWQKIVKKEKLEELFNALSSG